MSVILPVRNGGSFLAESVASIMAQSHARLELVVVDDHSDDGAVEALPGSEPRIRTLSSPGSGVVAAFQHGMSEAQGDYIARMDADDVSLPGRIEQQLALLAARPEVDICGTGVRFFPRSRVAGGNRHYERWLNGVVEPRDIHLQLFIESPIPNPSVLFRRSAIDRLGGYRETPWPEDYDLFLRADQAGMKMAKTRDVLLHWREHDGRLTHLDQRYSRARFQQAKAYYLASGRLPEREFLIWGAGPTGAQMFDLLKDCGRIAEGFVEVHPRRIGGRKRGVPVYHYEDALQRDERFLLVAVGARNARDEIRQCLDEAARREGRDYLFVA